MRLFARTAPLLSLLIAASASGAESGTTLSKLTPFGTARASGGAGEAAGEIIEFTAVSTIGKKTELVFLDKTTKKNHWLAKGETTAGITLLNYDPALEQAVVKVNGAEKILKLRQPQSRGGAGRPVAAVPTGFNVPVPATTSAPAVLTHEPVAAAAVPAGPATPQSQAQQETEARMLVSDLLEIGMAQRKAYEEKQKQAGGGNDTAAQTPVTDPAGTAPKS